jgi:hypothetical protein
MQRCLAEQCCCRGVAIVPHSIRRHYLLSISSCQTLVFGSWTVTIRGMDAPDSLACLSVGHMHIDTTSKFEGEQNQHAQEPAQVNRKLAPQLMVQRRPRHW